MYNSTSTTVSSNVLRRGRLWVREQKEFEASEDTSSVKFGVPSTSELCEECIAVIAPIVERIAIEVRTRRWTPGDGIDEPVLLIAMSARDMKCEDLIGRRVRCAVLKGFLCVADYEAGNVISYHDQRAIAHESDPFHDLAGDRDDGFRLIFYLFAL